MNLYKCHPYPLSLLFVDFLDPDHCLDYKKNVQFYLGIFTLFKKTIYVGNYLRSAKLLSAYANTFL